MNYIKIDGVRYNLTDSGINTNEDALKIEVKAEGKTFEEVKEAFSGLDDITVYGCIVQEDGRETDEYVAIQYADYTKLSTIQYDIEKDSYTVTMLIPNILEERITELEDAVNFLVMGGEE